MSAASSAQADILIVDDNPDNLRLLQHILSDERYEVRAATNGMRALIAARASVPDLLMLDISMPDMDGYEVCRQMKADSTLSSVPIIFISALDDALDKVRAFKTGGADYVTKPFQSEEVLARIENQLKISRLRKALEASKQDLERRNEELIKKNDALLKAQKRTDLVFSALSDVLPGTVLDEKYKLESKIGSGGFGAVFRATHIALNRAVAIKVFRPTSRNATSESLDRFRLEGVASSRVNHPNAVSVLDSGISAQGIAFLVMELLEGRTLGEELAVRPVLSPSRCAQILVPVCSALAVAHASGIIHRDIKPDNIFLHNGPEGEVVKVLDFGTAKLLGRPTDADAQVLTLHGWVVGTPAYSAPERLKGDPYDGRADVYSVGILLYRMLCGRVPFEGDEPYSIALQQITAEPQPLRELNPTIPTMLESLVARVLSKDPAQRPTAAEFAEQLDAARDRAAEVLESHARVVAASSDVPEDELETGQFPMFPPGDEQ